MQRHSARRDAGLHAKTCQPFTPLRAGSKGQRYAHSRLHLLPVLAVAALLTWGCGRRHSAPKAYAAFVANNESSTLAEVDLASFRVRASVPVAARPERDTLSPRERAINVIYG